MSETNNNVPAFPQPGCVNQSTGDVYAWPEPGMSLRDWFAGLAMREYIGIGRHRGNKEWIAMFSYDMADAMLKERLDDIIERAEAREDPK